MNKKYYRWMFLFVFALSVCLMHTEPAYAYQTGKTTTTSSTSTKTSTKKSTTKLSKASTKTKTSTTTSTSTSSTPTSFNYGSESRKVESIGGVWDDSIGGYVGGQIHEVSSHSPQVITYTTVKTTKKVVKKYKKGSKKVNVTTTTTVKTTTKKETTNYNTTETRRAVNIRTLCPKASSNVLSAFEKLNFRVAWYPRKQHAYSGIASMGPGVINVNDYAALGKEERTGYHELGHFVSFVAGSCDSSDEFKAAYNAEKNALSKVKGSNAAYGAQNTSEFFAECYASYILNPSQLKQYCPKSYQAVNTAVTKVTDARVASVWNVYGSLWKNN